MTRLEKLERKAKRTKVIIITLSIIMFVIMLRFMMALVLERGTREQNLIIILLCIFAYVYWCGTILYLFWPESKASLNIEYKSEKLKTTIPKQYNLKLNEYVEIKCKYTNIEETERDKFFKEHNARFYAKLISRDEIEVIVKDEKGELLDKPKKVTNFCYFDKHYKPKK